MSTFLEIVGMLTIIGLVLLAIYFTLDTLAEFSQVRVKVEDLRSEARGMREVHWDRMNTLRDRITAVENQLKAKEQQ